MHFERIHEAPAISNVGRMMYARSLRVLNDTLGDTARKKLDDTLLAVWILGANEVYNRHFHFFPVIEGWLISIDAWPVQ